MAILPWRAKRQLIYFGIFASVSLALIGGLVWYFWPKPICFDGRKNGGEEGIDCGGSCIPCLREIKNLSILWTRFFKNREGFYDAAALIDNSNLYAGLSSLKYAFKLYDANNVLIAIQENSTFINPGERRVIFESNIPTGPRIPRYVYIEFENINKWKYLKKEKSFLSVVRKDFVNFPFPRVNAEIHNELFSEVKNIFISAVLYDSEGNAVGVSSTKIDAIPPESSQWAFFTWPVSFGKEPAGIEIIAMTDLTK